MSENTDINLHRKQQDDPSIGTVGTATFILIVVLTVLGEFATGSFMPLLSQISVEFNQSAATLQYSVTALVISFALGQLVFGPISDSYGRRPVILFGLTLFFLGSLLALISQSFGMLIVARALQGLGASAGYVVGRAVVKDISTASTLPGYMSKLMMGFALVIIAAPYIGGTLGELLDWRAVFAVSIVAAVVTIALTHTILPETLSPSARQRVSFSKLPGAYAAVFQESTYLKYVFTHSFGYSGIFAFVGTFPLFARDAFNLSSSVLGGLMATTMGGMIIGLVLAGKISKRIGAEKCIRLGLVVMALSFLLSLPQALAEHYQLSIILIAQTIYMIGGGMVAPNTTASVMTAYPTSAGLAAAGLGFFSMAFAAATIWLVGQLYVGSYAEIIYVQLGLALASVISYLAFSLLSRERRAEQS